MRYIFPSFLLLAVMPAFATVDNGLLALAPSGAKMISAVDVGRARSSPFGQYILGRMNDDNPDFQEMIQETGFDPRHDVQDVLFAGTGLEGASDSARFGVLVRGNFDQSRIKKSLISKGATVQSYQGVEILLEGSTHNHADSNNRQHAFAFPDVDIAVMGDLASVQQMVANRANPSALDPALQQLVSSAGANHDAWFAALGSGSFLGGNLMPQAGPRVKPEALQSILQSSGGVVLGDVVQVSFDATTRSAQDATSLADVVRFGVSLVETQSQKDPRAKVITASLDNMTVDANGSNVHIGLSIPESSLEQLAAMNVQPGVKPTRQSGR